MLLFLSGAIEDGVNRRSYLSGLNYRGITSEHLNERCSHTYRSYTTKGGVVTTEATLQVR